MDHTNQYYEQFAAEFFGSTVGVDMAAIHQRFLAHLKPGAHILDAGCGSGRDAKAFAVAGFKVTAFDASAELARLASAHCGFEVAVRRFEDIDEAEAFDGIWCCASLLHVPLSAIPTTLDRLWCALRPGGTLLVGVDCLSLVGRLRFEHITRRTHKGQILVEAHPHSFRPRQVARMIERAGFTMRGSYGLPDRLRDLIGSTGQGRGGRGDMAGRGIRGRRDGVRPEACRRRDALCRASTPPRDDSRHRTGRSCGLGKIRFPTESVPGTRPGTSPEK